MEKKIGKRISIILIGCLLLGTGGWKMKDWYKERTGLYSHEIYNGFSGTILLDWEGFVISTTQDGECIRIENNIDIEEKFPLSEGMEDAFPICYPCGDKLVFWTGMVDDDILYYYDKQMNQHKLLDFRSLWNRAPFFNEIMKGKSSGASLQSEGRDTIVAIACRGHEAFFLTHKGVCKYNLITKEKNWVDEQGFGCAYFSVDGDNIFFLRSNNILCKIDGNNQIIEYKDVVAKDFVICEKGVYFNDMRNKLELSFYSFAENSVKGLGVHSEQYDVDKNAILYYQDGEILRRDIEGKGEVVAKTVPNVYMLRVFQDSQKIGIVDDKLNFTQVEYGKKK